MSRPIEFHERIAHDVFADLNDELYEIKEEFFKKLARAIESCEEGVKNHLIEDHLCDTGRGTDELVEAAVERADDDVEWARIHYLDEAKDLIADFTLELQEYFDKIKEVKWYFMRFYQSCFVR